MVFLSLKSQVERSAVFCFIYVSNFVFLITLGCFHLSNMCGRDSKHFAFLHRKVFSLSFYYGRYYKHKDQYEAFRTYIHCIVQRGKSVLENLRQNDIVLWRLLLFRYCASIILLSGNGGWNVKFYFTKIIVNVSVDCYELPVLERCRPFDVQDLKFKI